MSFDLVFFGGTGDLTWRKLMPALFQAFRHGKLPPGGRILAVARDDQSDSKYRSWDWNYGESPAFNLQRVQRFAIGEVDARLQVEQGRVKNAKFYGDFFSSRDIGDLEKALIGIRYHHDDILAAASSVRAEEIFDGVSLAELVKLLY